MFLSSALLLGASLILVFGEPVPRKFKTHPSHPASSVAARLRDAPIHLLGSPFVAFFAAY